MRVSFRKDESAQLSVFGNADVEDAKARVADRPIGELIREARKLSEDQVDQILDHQRSNGTRFGESAVALRLATNDDVVWALAQQFHYPCAPNRKHENPELVVASNPFSQPAEVFRDLRSQLLSGVLAPNGHARALAVLSPETGDGKTYVAANLAIAFSQLGGRTLLVDADMRTPRLRELFKVGNSLEGLSGILSGRASRKVIHQVPDLPSLYVLPAGAVPPNPLELVERPAFNLLLSELLMKFNHVVVDTPSASHGADSRVIAAKCGAALVVSRKGRSRMAAMQKLLSGLQRAPVKMAGVVVNEH